MEEWVVEVFLIDPETHEQVGKRLDEDEDLHKPRNIPDGCIVIGSARNPYTFPRSPVCPSS